MKRCAADVKIHISNCSIIPDTIYQIIQDDLVMSAIEGVT